MPEDGTDFGAHDSPVEDSIEINIPHPDQSRDLPAIRLIFLCMCWRVEALWRLLRDKPVQFHQELDKLLGRYDIASRIIRLAAKLELGGPSSSVSFIREEEFVRLTEILARACDDRGINSRPVHEFCHYANADLKAAEVELDYLVRCLKRELAGESTAHPEPARTVTPVVDHDKPPDQSSNPANSQDRYTFRLDGDIWQLKFENEEGAFSNTKGLQRIHNLLKEPDTPISGLVLCGGDLRCATLTHSIAETSDQEARAAYRHQLAELDEEIEQAKKNLDNAALDRCSEERKELLAQVKRDKRLGGRSRRLGNHPPAKTALLAAQTSIRREYKKLKDAELTSMADHLQQHIETDEDSLVYKPPSPALGWKF